MKAIKVHTMGQPQVDSDVPIPSVAEFPGFVLVKVSHVAVQPCDNLFTHTPYFFTSGITIGSDCSGVVTDVHPSVKHINKGDRVGGAVFPSNRTTPNGGAWAEYVLMKADALVLLDRAGPLDDEHGAAVGVGLWTAYIGLYKFQKLPLPGTAEAAEGKGGWVLVCGGATCTGMYMSQLAKLSGCRVVATASERNFALLKDLGVDAVVDYALSVKECAAQVMAVAGGKLPTAFDCVNVDTTTELCDEVLAQGAKCYNLSPVSKSKRDDVESVFIAGGLANGESFVMSGQEIKDEYHFGDGTREFLRLTEGLMKEGKLRPPLVEASSGWDAVLERMNDVAAGKPRALKYVVDVRAQT